MALEPKELFGDAVTQTPNLRAFPYEGGIKPGTLAAISGAPELPHLTPLAWDGSNEEWAVWADDVTEEVYVITANATPATDGTFTLSIDGETTAAIDHDADDATIQAALEALSNVAPGDVTVVDGSGGLGSASGTATITFGGAYSGVAVVVTADFGNLTGNTHVLSNPADGAGSATDQIDGFLWKPDADGQATSATGEVLVQVLRRGQVHHDDVPLPTTSSQTQPGLTAALKDQRLRTLGLDIVGVAGIH